MKPSSSHLKTIKSLSFNTPRTPLNPSKSVDFTPNPPNLLRTSSNTSNLFAPKIRHETTPTFKTCTTNDAMDEGRVKKIITSFNKNVQKMSPTGYLRCLRHLRQ